MGLITQSNAKYYTGNEVNFFTSSVSSLQPDIGVDLNDIVPG